MGHVGKEAVGIVALAGEWKEKKKIQVGIRAGQETDGAGANMFLFTNMCKATED